MGPAFQFFWDAMDQPSIDAVNSYFISQCAKVDGLKSVLSGVGADELFGGYASFNRVPWIKRLRRLPSKKMLGRILGLFKTSYARIVFLEIQGPVGDYLFLRGIHTPNGIAELLSLPVEKVMATIRTVNLDLQYSGDDLQYASNLESKVGS